MFSTSFRGLVFCLFASRVEFQSTYSKVWLISLIGNKLVEIFKKPHDSSSVSDIFSDNSNDNVIDEIALADVIINDDSDKEEGTCKTFLRKTMEEVTLGGVGVKCSPRDPRFAGSNLAEVDGFFSGHKNPEHKSSRG